MSLWAFVKDSIEVGLLVSEQTSCLDDFFRGAVTVADIYST